MEREHSSQVPDIVIAGAPKCGSSSLFFWLASHPSICASKKKETHFLRDRVVAQNEDLNVHEHGSEAYKKAFPDCSDKLHRLEATPIYLYEQTPLKLLSQASPLPTIVFLLREPADRVHSRYRFARYRRKRIRMPFKEFLEKDHETLGWNMHPIEQSKYSKYLAPWLETFGQDRIKVFLFEEMKKDARSFMEKVARELDLDPGFYEQYGFQKRNASKKIRSKWLHGLGERVQPFVPKKLQEKLTPLYMKLNAGSAPPVSQKELAKKEELRKSFLKEYEDLERLFPDLDLGHWREQSYQPD